MSELVAVILAAGKGTRMKSKLPKVLHKVGGQPMLQHVLDAADAAGAARKVVIVGHEAELGEAMVGTQAQMALQAEQLGTGHAVMQTEAVLKDFCGTVMIICGDTPLLEAGELRKFYEGHVASQAAATVLTAFMDLPAMAGSSVTRPGMFWASSKKKTRRQSRKPSKKSIPVFTVWKHRCFLRCWPL